MFTTKDIRDGRDARDVKAGLQGANCQPEYGERCLEAKESSQVAK